MNLLLFYLARSCFRVISIELTFQLCLKIENHSRVNDRQSCSVEKYALAMESMGGEGWRSSSDS